MAVSLVTVIILSIRFSIDEFFNKVRIFLILLLLNDLFAGPRVSDLDPVFLPGFGSGSGFSSRIQIYGKKEFRKCLKKYTFVKHARNAVLL